MDCRKLVKIVLGGIKPYFDYVFCNIVKLTSLKIKK